VDNWKYNYVYGLHERKEVHAPFIARIFMVNVEVFGYKQHMTSK
jgi:hypothetical protein